jgi:cytohesin
MEREDWEEPEPEADEIEEKLLQLYEAIDDNDEERFEYLLREYNTLDVNTKSTTNHQSLLHCACDVENINICRLLIERGANVNAVDNWWDTPLHYVAKNGPIEIMELLIESGSWVNVPSPELKTPLHYAALSGVINRCELLVRHGAEVNAKDEMGQTPLHYAACILDGTQICSYLINQGGNVNARDSIGKTPIFDAAFNGVYETCVILLSNNANIDYVDNDEHSPSEIARIRGHMNVYDLLTNPNLHPLHQN